MRLIFIGILFGFMLTACANVSRLEKDSLVAFGELLDGSREPLYYLIRVDLKKSFDARTMSSLLKLSPDMSPISLEKMRPELVSRYLPSFTPPAQWPEYLKQKAKENDDYAGGGLYIRFHEDQLLYISICSHCSGGRENPIVGTPDGQHFYMLPLTEQQVTEVFGPPDRIYKVSEVRY